MCTKEDDPGQKNIKGDYTSEIIICDWQVYVSFVIWPTVLVSIDVHAMC